MRVITAYLRSARILSENSVTITTIVPYGLVEMSS